MKSKYSIIKNPDYPNEVLASFKGKTIWSSGIIYTPFIPLVLTEPRKKIIQKFEDWLRNKRTQKIIHVQSMEMMNQLFGEIKKDAPTIPWLPIANVNKGKV